VKETCGWFAEEIIEEIARIKTFYARKMSIFSTSLIGYDYVYSPFNIPGQFERISCI